MNNDPLGLNSVNENLAETAKAFELMQKTLLVFCGIVAIGIVVVSIAIFRQSSN